MENVTSKDEAKSWIKNRLNFLPGNTWPENWILSEAKNNDKSELINNLSLDEHELDDFIDEAIRAGKHDEFFTLSIKVNLDKEFVSKIFSNFVIKFNKDKFDEIEDFIMNYLE